MQTLTWSPDLRKTVQLGFKTSSFAEAGKNLSFDEKLALDNLIANQKKGVIKFSTQAYWS
jgi:hypothetical protein